MRKGLLFLGTAVAAWMLASGSASAFEQVTVAPAETAPPAAAQPAPSFAFSAPEPAAQPKEKEGGFKLPGLGSFNFLPKLDFGLELMYGSPEPESARAAPRESGPAATPDDLTIMGTVRRRF